MKIQFALGMAIGLALGATAVHALHAQTRPPTYYVAEVDVTDPEAYIKEFVPKAATSAEAYGGRTLAAGSKVTAVEGTPPKNRVGDHAVGKPATAPVLARVGPLQGGSQDRR